MRSVLARLNKFVRISAVVVVAAQILAMLGLTAHESFQKKRRTIRKFPRTAPSPLEVDGSEVAVYTYGEDLYADMLAAIDAAQHTIYFETFIWKGDATGKKFRAALGQAAARGVDVYVIWDEFANLVVPRSFFRNMPPGINVMRHPAFPRPWRPTTWGRDHRKIMVVDGQVGFLGGYNIGSLYATQWRDTHARVTGQAVAEIENAFVDFWNGHRKKGHPELPEVEGRPWRTDIKVHRNSPRVTAYPVRNLYLEAIDRASSRIWLTHAYLIPDDDLAGALYAAARRGVDVKIIVPEISNHVVADWLSRGYYQDFLDSGVRLFLYKNAMVHSKTAVIDGEWSTIGTTNLDRMSLAGNYEVNLEFVSATVASHMEQVFEEDLTNTVELTSDRWARRGAMAKFTERLLRPWRFVF